MTTKNDAMRRALLLALLVIVAAGAFLWWRSARPGAPAARSLDAARSLSAVERQDLVAQRFAPVFLQNRKPKRTRTDNGDAFEDHFVRVEYDGDWNGFDNSASLREAASLGKDLSAHVYYGVQESERHYYLHFAYFHPRDPKYFGFHENDVEGGMVVVRKASSWSDQLTRRQLVMVQAQAHNRFSYRRASELCVTGTDDPIREAECAEGTTSSKTHPILVSQAGRGFPWNHGHGTEIPRSRGSLKEDAFVYVPGAAAGVPALPPTGAVDYKLVSLTGDRDGDGALDTAGSLVSPPGLWDRRFDPRIYGQARAYEGLANGEPLGHALQSGDKCKANLQWGWTGVEGVPRGMFFLDPGRWTARATLAKHGVDEPTGGAVYVSNVYLNGARIPGIAPAPGVPVFKCDCAHMMSAFGSSGTWGIDSLEAGPGCSMARLEAAPPAVARARIPAAARWSTCEELEEWVAEEDREAVTRVGAPDQVSCALRVSGGVYLRLPSNGDRVPLGEVGSLPPFFSPSRYGALRVTARAATDAGGYAMGGFWLHREGRYDESMATVPFFGRQRLAAGPWQNINLPLDDSPHVRSDDVVFVALGPDIGPRLAVSSAELESVEVGDVEIDSIELVPIAAARALRAARAPLAITGIEPARARFGEPVTIRGSGFASEQCDLNFVTFGEVILKITGCTAGSITVDANGVGEAAVRVRTSGGRVAQAPQSFAIAVEP